MNDAQEILSQARELVRRGWTQGVVARNDKGGEVGAGDAEAVSWCATGAVWKIFLGRSDSKIFYAASEFLLEALRELTWFQDTVAAWQDSLPSGREGQEKVLTLFDHAIVLAGKSGVENGG